MLFFRAEVAFSYSANGAYPIFGYVFECCSRVDSAVGVAHSGVVDVAADVANVLFHVCVGFLLVIMVQLVGNKTNNVCLLSNNFHYFIYYLLWCDVVEACVVFSQAWFVAIDGAWSAWE